jgi:hypothetical protein
LQFFVVALFAMQALALKHPLALDVVPPCLSSAAILATSSQRVTLVYRLLLATLIVVDGFGFALAVSSDYGSGVITVEG